MNTSIQQDYSGVSSSGDLDEIVLVDNITKMGLPCLLLTTTSRYVFESLCSQISIGGSGTILEGYLN
jgi:hypothetical protein